MSLILSIDTSGTVGTVMVQQGDAEVSSLFNHNPADHAAFLPTAIHGVLLQAGVSMAQLSAVSVCAGPGSYTGIRVAVAAAKGLCFGSDKPLILVSSLELLVQEQILKGELPAAYICPMIDARRNEVFCAMYNSKGDMVEGATAKTVDENFYNNYVRHAVLYTGNGSFKALTLEGVNPQLVVSSVSTSAAMRKLSLVKFLQKEFTDVGAAKPLYAKAFYSTQQKHSHRG